MAYTSASKHFPLPKGYLSGFRSACASNTTVPVQPGICRDSTDTMNIEFAGATADITTSGANGLDTGSEAANTWYAVHTIASSTGADIPKLILSTSAVAPTFPTGYDKFRQVGWVRNDGNSNFIQFRSYDDGPYKEIRYDYGDQNATLRALNAGTQTGSTSVDISAWVPPVTTDTLVLINAIMSLSAGAQARTGSIFPTAMASGEAYIFDTIIGATVTGSNNPQHLTIGTASGATRNFSYLVSNAQGNLTVYMLGYEIQL